MKFLLTTAMICVFFVGFGMAQLKDGTYNVGKDREGDTWYLDSNLVVPVKDTDGYVMAIYTGTVVRIVFFFVVDCSDNTYKLTRSLGYRNDVLFHQEDIKSKWANFQGYSGRAAKLVCDAHPKGRRLPAIGEGRID